MNEKVQAIKTKALSMNFVRPCRNAHSPVQVVPASSTVGPPNAPAQPTHRFLRFPRWISPTQAPLAVLSPAVIHVREANGACARTASTAVELDSHQVALRRDVVRLRREELRTQILNLVARGWDEVGRLNLVRKLEADIAQAKDASPPDIGKQKSLEQTRREILQNALDSMTERVRAGELLAPLSAFPPRSEYYFQLASAKRAREQRHTVLKLAEASAAAQQEIEALDRRMRELALG